MNEEFYVTFVRVTDGKCATITGVYTFDRWLDYQKLCLLNDTKIIILEYKKVEYGC